MPFTPITDDTALRTELQTDPASLGYSPHVTAGNDGELAARLNQVRAAYQVANDPKEVRDVLKAFVPSEFSGLQTGPAQRLEILLAVTPVEVGTPAVNQMIRECFASNSTTRTQIAAMEKRQGSRAEVVWGTGTVITSTDVGRSLRG